MLSSCVAVLPPDHEHVAELRLLFGRAALTESARGRFRGLDDKLDHRVAYAQAAAKYGDPAPDPHRKADALAQTFLGAARHELREAARHFERAIRSHIRAKDAEMYALRRPAHQIVRSGHAPGRGQDGAATTRTALPHRADRLQAEPSRDALTAVLGQAERAGHDTVALLTQAAARRE